MKRTAFVLLILLSIGARLSDAQPIEEDAFWLLLEQTDQRLAETPPNLESLYQQWAVIDAVQLDGATIGSAALDLAWIRDALSSGAPAQLQTLRHRIRALLNYHAKYANRPSSDISVAALDRVLSDARFQYDTVVPTPLPTALPRESPPRAPASADASFPAQLILAVIGTLAVFVALSYIARSVNMQSAEIKITNDEDPTNFAEARQRAETHETARNYRDAIRYLYLSSLLLLDEHNLIRYDPSLTNREHLQQIAAKPHLFAPLREVINIFEDVWYGFQPVDDAFYQQYRRHIDQLRQIVQ